MSLDNRWATNAAKSDSSILDGCSPTNMQVSLHVDILLSGESGDVLEKVAILIPSNDSDVN